MADQDFEIPLWLDESYLNSVLQVKFPEQRPPKVSQFEVKVATKKGENYASEMFRISITTTSGEQLSWVLKKPHSSAANSGIVDAYNFFGKEMKLYTEHLNDLLDLLRSVDEFEELTPELIHCDKESQTIILEDLKSKGFATGDRKHRICRESAKVAMRKLAKFHASSMVLNRREAGRLETDIYDMIISEGPFYAYLAQHPFAMIEEVKSWGEEFAEIVPKLEKIAPNLRELLHKATISKRGLNVLAHVDLWYTNLLIKKDDTSGVVEDLRMIDFQLCSWAGLTTDLFYFIFRALNEEDYEGGFDYCVEIYHSHLERVLRKLEYDPLPMLEDILADIKDNFFYAYYCGLIAKVFVDGAPEDGAKNLVELTDKDNFNYKTKFRHPRMNKEMRVLIKWLDREGALDL